jgi:hypothetical protein
MLIEIELDGVRESFAKAGIESGWKDFIYQTPFLLILMVFVWDLDRTVCKHANG